MAVVVDNQKFDFSISGAGLVGCLVAIQLSKVGLKCCLIEKNKTPVLLDNSDKVVWVVGKRMDDRFKPLKDSRKILQIEFK